MTLTRIPDLTTNLAMDGDSYKWSHWNQYPPGTSRMMSYFESRGGQFEECTLFGLQYQVHRYLARKVSHADVTEARDFAKLHGEPFNEAGWKHIVEEYGGRLPVKIRAIPEGTVVKTGNAILTIECDDPQCFWIVSWLETMLVRLWYPSTIAMMSRESKKVLKHYLDLSADVTEDEILFKLHDFGSRGVATLEQARLGGAAHLLSFLGSDTIEGIRLANHYYHCPMAGFSIPATEHSTVSMWGREREFEMYDHYLDTYLDPKNRSTNQPLVAACVSDSFDIFAATHAWSTGALKDKIKASGGTLVIRPDSGEPHAVLSKMFGILEENLGNEICKNKKGFKVLPPYLRVIQGDGIELATMRGILELLTSLGWSASNIGFGSGGGLLQKVNRDTQKWAFKCCAAEVNGKALEVRKDPITDPGKRSKAGRLDLINRKGEFETIALESGQKSHPDSIMQTMFDHGEILADTSFDECRERMRIES